MYQHPKRLKEDIKYRLKQRDTSRLYETHYE